MSSEESNIRILPQDIIRRVLAKDEVVDMRSRMLDDDERDILIHGIILGILTIWQAVHNSMDGHNASPRGCIGWSCAEAMESRWRSFFIGDWTEARKNLEALSDYTLRYIFIYIFDDLTSCTRCVEGQRFVVNPLVTAS